MGPSPGIQGLRRPTDGPRLSQPGAAESSAIMWRINGYQASLMIWTQDEWSRLDPRPPDAQYHPSGIWCALRIK